MNILYDHQIFETQQFGGISRYFYELWRHAAIAGFSAQIDVRYGNNAYLREVDQFRSTMQPFEDPWRVYLERTNVPAKEGLLWIKQRFFPQKKWKGTLKAQNRQASLEKLVHDTYDVFHPTYYHPYFCNALKGKPFVLTIFDMIYEIYPEYFRLGTPISRDKRQLCKAAAKIIAISQHTKQDLINIFRLDPDKIEVVYLANSLKPHQDVASSDLPEAYLLFTGSRLVYKNFYFFVRAIANILIEENLKLVCTGETFSPEERHFFESLGVQDQVIHIFADDAMLAYLYQHARAFVFPSLYEGFGIPVLEAFACGCPSILSNTSSLPEVGGDAAVYFEPKDVRSIQDAVTNVIFHEDVRNDLITKGAERVKLFSWETTARKTGKVYKKALNL